MVTMMILSDDANTLHGFDASLILGSVQECGAMIASW